MATRKHRRPTARSVTTQVATQLHQLAQANLARHQQECARCGVKGADVLNYCDIGYRMAQSVVVTGRRMRGDNGKQVHTQERLL